MWNTPEDRVKAAKHTQIMRNERKRRSKLPLRERIRLWKDDAPGDEIEDLYELLAEIENAIFEGQTTLRELIGFDIDPGVKRTVSSVISRLDGVK
jgi:hypothetical protein